VSEPVIDHRAPGPLTDVGDEHRPLLADLPHEPVEICRVAQGLVIEPHDAESLGVPAERITEKELRRSDALLAAVVAQGATTLSRPCEPEQRVVGTCRHFATLACALLRFRAVPARARCGFAGYFDPGSWVDHWIVEHHDGERWVRIDAEVLGVPFVPAPDDLAEGEFLTGGEAWALVRRGEADPQAFGVFGFPDNWGPSEIQGNAVRDLAALNKVEMLPWDTWGRMEAAYDGETGADYDELMDVLAATCAEDRHEAVRELGAHPDLAVPADLIV
jgi:hypothetical protein